MKLLPLLLLTAVTTLAAPAKKPVKFPELALTDGTVLKEVQVLKVEPDAIRVEHSDGVYRIKMENLPEAVQKQFGFDAEKAAAFRAVAEEENARIARQEHEARVAALLEKRREEQEEDVAKGREAFYAQMEADEYSYPRLDMTLMATIRTLKEAGREDLAALVEEDRALLRERELVRPGERLRRERDQLQARIRQLETQMAGMANRPAEVVHTVDTVPVFVDRPVIVNRPVHVPSNPTPCPPSHTVNRPTVIPSLPQPIVAPPSVCPPSLPSAPTAVENGAHLYRR
jgi:hypothetical protein